MPKLERRIFEKKVSEWMARKMPMLAQESSEPLEGFEYYNSWMDPRYPRGDSRRWGVLNFRLNAEYDHTTSLILVYIGERPTS